MACTLRRPRTEDVHVSESDGARDLPRTIWPETLLMGWARERVQDMPAVLESCWHRTEPGERRVPLALLRA